MLTLQVQTQLSSEDLLHAIEQLSQPELEVFAERIMALRLQNRVPALSQEESELLLCINQGVPLDVQQRYDALIAKRQSETLTPEEYTELLYLTNQIEQLDAKRIEQLARLAQIRRIPLSQLMHELGTPSHVYE